MRDVAILRSEYHRLGEAGVFEGRRVELVSGHIIDLRPMSPSHRTALRVLNRTFVELVPRTWDVMVQVPLDLADDSEPEPDYSFVTCRGAARRDRSTCREAAIAFPRLTVHRRR